MAFTKKFVFDSEQLVRLHNEVTTTCQVHGLATRRPIERFGNRCTPVNDYWLTLFIRHGKTSDMETFEFVVFEAIDTAKYQGGISQVKVGEALHKSIVNGIALEAILEGSAHSGLGVAA